MNKTHAIGVIDSGVGGLTVAREILTSMPNESIVYLGDSINCPYGNMTEEQILELSLKMIRFLEEKGVKCVAVACNTISSLIDKVRPYFSMPIVSFIECGSKVIIDKKPSSIGLIATNFTVKMGKYQKLITEALPACKVVGVGSRNLSSLVDRGHINDSETDAEITMCIDKILEKEDVKSVILGCTHYPIAYDCFKKNYPGIEFINPAAAQMNEVKRILKENNALNDCGGKFELYSTGSTDNYIKILKMMNVKLPEKFETITL